MGSYRQTLLDDLSTLVTLLACETRVHSDNLMPGTCSLCTENIEERAPTGVHDGFCKMVIFDHIIDSQVFNDNPVIAFGIGLGCLEMVISPLSIDLQVRLCYVLSSLTASMTAFLTAAQLALFASQGFLRRAIEARVLYRVPFRVSQEGFETHINADVRMLAYAGKMFVLWFSFAYDQGIPMSISMQDKMDGFRLAL